MMVIIWACRLRRRSPSGFASLGAYMFAPRWNGLDGGVLIYYFLFCFFIVFFFFDKELQKVLRVFQFFYLVELAGITVLIWFDLVAKYPPCQVEYAV
jgi:hypothetical protein